MSLLKTTEYKKFTNCLMILKIEEAKHLLREHSDLSNEAISQASGFSIEHTSKVYLLNMWE